MFLIFFFFFSKILFDKFRGGYYIFPKAKNYFLIKSLCLTKKKGKKGKAKNKHTKKKIFFSRKYIKKGKKRQTKFQKKRKKDEGNQTHK